MSSRPLPPRDKLTLCFAHAAYRIGERFALRETGINWFEVRSLAELEARIAEADVLLVSGLWRNELIARAPRLAFIQSVSAGTDQYSRDALRAAGIRGASAQGANERAVAEHAIALILALARKIPEARDNQAAKKWRGMIGDFTQREDELGGKTLAIVGLGRIGARLATLAKAFDLRVIGVRQDPSRGAGAADTVVGIEGLHEAMAQADFVALTCPLTPATTNLIDAKALAAMKPSSYLVNVARGKVVNEPALVEALAQGRIAGAALDCTWEEPLPATSPLWAMPNVLITPHTAGETRRYEDNVIDLLMENLERIGRGEDALKNQFV
ncbi:Putative 2-hydroxyacid dehydrogenase [Usitatibacter rugosus]|uniref:2-hydroxyacid dehydrogenase n=1 Tax=Usitatibacter rugosus TaxID=2732067 RepID=A0A6M4GUH2_9PROT|nr:D-2-hydroxyacid dehydrogenase [Usitatibacter rugosus]QJR10508.1 Putative 2-hydroxyacid dehydrogenase [Usitatibacter rugosus]